MEAWSTVELVEFFQRREMDIFEGRGEGIEREAPKISLERGNNWEIRVVENTEKLVNFEKKRNIFKTGKARQCKYMFRNYFTVKIFFQKQICWGNE